MLEPVAFLLGRCPRCAGDLAKKEDSDGHYLGCIQCGLHLNVEVGVRGRLKVYEPVVLERIGSGKGRRFYAQVEDLVGG